MTAWLRRAGRGRLPDGTTLLWSVAEGRRGRRWRSTTWQSDGTLALDMLLEADPEGRFWRLELTGPAGMLTMHPEAGEGLVSGNVVSAGGVEPISLPWSPGMELRVAGSPIPEIVTSRGRGAGVTEVEVIQIEADFRVFRVRVPVGEGSGPPSDARGVPTLDDSSEWPLEVPSAP